MSQFEGLTRNFLSFKN